MGGQRMHWAVFRVKRHRLSWAAVETSLLEAGKQECESRRQALSGPLLLNQNTVREPPLSDAYLQHWNICKSVGGSPLEVENIVGHNKA